MSSFAGRCRPQCGAAWSCGWGASPVRWRKPSISGCWRRPGSRRSVWSRRGSTRSRRAGSWGRSCGPGSRSSERIPPSLPLRREFRPQSDGGGLAQLERPGTIPRGERRLTPRRSRESSHDRDAARLRHPLGRARSPQHRRVGARALGLRDHGVRSSPMLPLRVASLLVVPVIPLVAQQTGTVSGTVVATESGAPLVGASVVVVGTARSVLTNEKGQYRLSVPAGVHSVRARLIGHEAAEQRVVVPAGQTVTVDFKLTATPLSLNEIVVIGARTSRTAVETPVPVDVITSQAVQETGHTEVNQILATLAPSFNASHQTISDGSDHINPASLRGLGPDQVRSEEHTSELQSQSNLVCRLLLEKKKKNQHSSHRHTV